MTNEQSSYASPGYDTAGTDEQQASLSGSAVIRVIGVGGGGVNAISRMMQSDVHGVEFVAMNTDSQSLMAAEADTKIELGQEKMRGLGAGADPERGREAAEASIQEIEEVVKGADMVFVAVGEGGGTGTGAAPVVAKVAHDADILTVGVVTKPFSYEGRRRADNAEKGIRELSEAVDTLIVIPNDRLLSMGDRITVSQAFKEADNVLSHGVLGITQIIQTSAMINVDFNDVKAVMKDARSAMMGIGRATGEDRAATATEQAISSPLLEADINGATGLLVLIQASPDFGIEEYSTIGKILDESTDSECNTIIGFDENTCYGDEVTVTVIATGFDTDSEKKRRDDYVAGKVPAAEVPKTADVPPSQTGLHAAVNPVTRPTEVVEERQPEAYADPQPVQQPEPAVRYSEPARYDVKNDIPDFLNE